MTESLGYIVANITNLEGLCARRRYGHHVVAVLQWGMPEALNLTADLFAGFPRQQSRETLGAQAAVLRAFATHQAAALIAEVTQVSGQAPFRHLVTPGGYRMSVAMTNCGSCGWVSDTSGYRYAERDPLSGRRWPRMPDSFRELAAAAAAELGFVGFAPDACLINRYEPGTKLSLHRDSDEGDLSAPIVSVSLGLPAVFLWGGPQRSARPVRVPLEHGDVVVWGGPTRLNYHGVLPIKDPGDMSGRCRLNLTFRKASGSR